MYHWGRFGGYLRATASPEDSPFVWAHTPQTVCRSCTRGFFHFRPKTRRQHTTPNRKNTLRGLHTSSAVLMTNTKEKVPASGALEPPQSASRRVAAVGHQPTAVS